MKLPISLGKLEPRIATTQPLDAASLPLALASPTESSLVFAHTTSGFLSARSMLPTSFVSGVTSRLENFSYVPQSIVE
jgi:hypothetical protein